MTRLAALIVAAGKGLRTASSVPKQFTPLAGKALLAHACQAFQRHGAFQTILVVVPPADLARARDLIAGNDLAFIPGGNTRQDSVRLGLDHLAGSPPDYVFVHDGARPVLNLPLLDRLIAGLNETKALVPALPVSDTLYREIGDRIGDSVDRTGLLAMQTPQVFEFTSLLAAHRAAVSSGDPVATDDVGIVRRAGMEVTIVPGDPDNIKVTWPGDFTRAERLLRSAQEHAMENIRVGQGFDVHAFTSGDRVILGGVQIPHDRALLGHSDADVVLHALTDALLGAIGAGDIGVHFPPSDPVWKGADSSHFVSHAVERIRARDARIVNLDLTIICQAPAIGPHRTTIVNRVAEICGLPSSQVNVKATTTERLGFTGRKEGIAALAVANVAVPRQETVSSPETSQ